MRLIAHRYTGGARRKIQPYLPLTPPLRTSSVPNAQQCSFSRPSLSSHIGAAHRTRNAPRSSESGSEDEVLDFSLSGLRNYDDNSFLPPSCQNQPRTDLHPHQSRNRKDGCDAVLTVVYASGQSCRLCGLDSVAYGC